MLVALIYVVLPPIQHSSTQIHDEQVIHNVPNDTNLEGTRLIAISESKDRPTAEIILFDDAEFWETYLQDKGMDFLKIDPDDPSHKEEVKIFNMRASERNIQGSYIAHVRGTTLINMMALPKTTDEIKKMVEGVQ